MPKSNTRAESARKPLTEISNGGKSSKAVKKKISEDEGQVRDDSLHRLVLVQSDLSNLFHQVDELVVQAFKLNRINKKGRKEIESFTHLLSEMNSSLKSWVPRIRKLLSILSVEPKNLQRKILASESLSPASGEVEDIVDVPVEPELGSLVSPSPLVSWRADSTAEGGRQLFLLTPLPRSKALSSKYQRLTRSVCEKISDVDAPPTTTLGLPSLFTTENTNDDLLEGVEMKLNSNVFSDFAFRQAESSTGCGFVSPPRFSNRDTCMFLMTPRFKMSPPKSCVLLEPISESTHQCKENIPKSTPFPLGFENSSGSESSDSAQVQETLALKYPEICGLQPANKSGMGRKEVEASLDWFVSPPKTCVLMEPPDEKLPRNAPSVGELSKIGCVLDEKLSSLTIAGVAQGGHQSAKKSRNRDLVLMESTPMKESESTVQRRKLPGENTLKKELWTKFEAASTHALPFDVSLLEERAQKGFLDRLDEASCDEISSLAKDFR